MRMHPVVSGILERIVPAGGLTLSDGRVIAPGTKVGINPWVLNRNKDVYGEDADVFRPERRLRGEGENEEMYEARLKTMKAIDFTFGAGRRVCVGSNMATVEIHKLTSTLFSRFDVSNACAAWEEYRVLTDGCSFLWIPKTDNGLRDGGGSLLSIISRSGSSAGLRARLRWFSKGNDLAMSVQFCN